jgi:hypothetical protein
MRHRTARVHSAALSLFERGLYNGVNLCFPKRSRLPFTGSRGTERAGQIVHALSAGLIVLALFVALVPAGARAEEVIWTRQLGTAADDYARGSAADPTGVYVVGATERTPPGQTSSGSSDAFVTKYDSKGDQKWIRQYWLRQFGTTEADYSFGVAVDATGAYVLGQTAGSLPGYANAGRFDAFLAKLN